MLAFIESIIKLLVNFLFADKLAQENQRLKQENQKFRQREEELVQENQQLKQEKEGLARAKAGVIENHFSLFQKYLALNKQKEELARKLEQYQSPRLDINQQFKPEDWKVIDPLLQEFNPSEELSI